MRLKRLLQILGPGLIYAGAAVGVSHLVQSTRAGASFGFYLIWVLLFANFIKYPFFEFAPRYVSATGKSLIDGYQKLGKWAIVSFTILTLLTMFIIQAALTVVTAGLVSYVFNLNIEIFPLCAIILLITSLLLIIGKYSALDKIMKMIIVVLAISTIIAVVSAFGNPIEHIVSPTSFNWLTDTHIFFLIAFVGWMPSPIDVSVWTSLWSVAKQKELGFKPTLRQSLLDFKIGYIGTTLLALGFLLLGALIMYGSGEDLSPDGTVFAGQLINMYTNSIGSWSKWVISIAAITTMFSTILTCLDAYPRVLKPTTEILFPKLIKIASYSFTIWILILTVGTLILLGYFTASMRFMVDLATTLSFVTAPILAFMNYKVITHKHMPESMRPKRWLRIYAWIGIFFLSSFTLFFIFWRFFN